MPIITEILELNVDSIETPHRVIPMPMDGNCLFHSIAYSIYNSIDDEQSDLIRHEIVQYVCKNWEEFNAWTVDEEGEPYESSDIYRSEMLNSGTFGSVCELKAAGCLYPLCIEVYRDRLLHGVFGAQDRPVKRFLFYGDLNSGHYDVLLPLGPEFFGSELKAKRQFKRNRKIRNYYSKKRLVAKLKASAHKTSLCLSKSCNLLFRTMSRGHLKRYGRRYNTNSRCKKKKKLRPSRQYNVQEIYLLVFTEAI